MYYLDLLLGDGLLLLLFTSGLLLLRLRRGDGERRLLGDCDRLRDRLENEKGQNIYGMIHDSKGFLCVRGFPVFKIHCILITVDDIPISNDPYTNPKLAGFLNPKPIKVTVY